MSARVSSSAADRQPLDVTQVPLTGVHLIEASAGTGKTYTITSLVLRLLVQQERPIESILAVTFTNAATAELKGRVYERIAQARNVLSGARDAGDDPVLRQLLSHPDRRRARRLLDMALQNVDRAAIFTIHGFAARMLQDHALETKAREDAELIGDQRALVQDVVTDFWCREVAPLPRETFEQLGGSGFFQTLVRVGLATAGAQDVPLVRWDADFDLETRVHELGVVFEEAREAFSVSGSELRDLLVQAKSLNRNKYRPASVEADYLAYVRYFERGEPTWGHPVTDRYTPSKVASSVKKNHPPVDHPLLFVLGRLHEANQAVAEAALAFSNHLRARLCIEVRRRVAVEHDRAGTQSFDGLLHDLCAALVARGPALASRIRALLPVALIDEFQDTDPEQYEIFRRIYCQQSGPAAQRSALYLIGDPKQSIYAFRGADVQTYLQAAREATGGTWTLTTSYRASPSLVGAQNALFSNPRNAFCVPGIGYQPVQARPGAKDALLDSNKRPLPGIRIIETPSSDEGLALQTAADEVARLLAAGHQLDGRPVSPRNVAVLTRTNRQAEQVQALLRKLCIPAVMHGDRSVFESPEALEMRRVMQALAEPGNRTLSRSALSTRLLGLSAFDLDRLESDHQLLEKWSADLRNWGSLWLTRGIAHALEAAFAETNLSARTLAELDGERRMTNLRHLLELLHEAELTEHLGVVGLLRYFEGAIADPSSFSMAVEARQLRLESDEHAVTLTTAHKSKGLEYDIVFLPALGLGDRLYGDEAFRYFDPEENRSLFEMRHKDSRGASEDIHNLEARQESLRLAYVALTRAKHHVVALAPPSRQFSSLGYLLHEAQACEPGGVEPFVSRLKDLSEPVRSSEIDALVSRSGGTVRREAISTDPAPAHSFDVAGADLEAPQSLPLVEEREKTSSFSTMTRGAQASLSRAAREGRDVDEVQDEPVGAEGSPPEKDPSCGRCLLSDFPRGARPGDALHAVFEHAPFSEGTPQERRQIVIRELLRRGYAARSVDEVAAAVEDVLATPFAGTRADAPIVLGQLGPADRVPEMEFGMPVGAEYKRFSPARLAAALGYVEAPPGAPRESVVGRSEDAVLSAQYLEALSRLSFSAFSGFLRGFIDLVFVWEGRLYGLDYKSNFLGEDYEDYDARALSGAMEHHHYLLQALLYAVAIHRYGKLRIFGYDYDEHFGGMHYLFVRGMHPVAPSRGVFAFRPARATIEALERALEVPG